MTMFDNIMKRHNSVGHSSSNLNHTELLSRRARELIEELVSPLSKPNQQVIDEVLMIISQTAHLPDSAVNKNEVQNITRNLLFQLVEPISNPNKQLIDELLSIVSGQFQQVPVGAVSSEVSQNVSNDQTQNNVGLSSLGDKQKVKGHFALSEEKSFAMGQAPYPSNDPTNVANQNQPASQESQNSVSNVTETPNKTSSQRSDKDTRSVVNLILEQIKELITITNTLNSKIKSHQVRLDTYDDAITELKKRSTDVDDRMGTFEKNMEKFIGLYEVVTNQYNPFIESQTYSDNTSVDNNSSNNNNLNNTANHAELNVAPTQNIPVTVEEVKPVVLNINGTEIKSLHDFSDLVLVMDDNKFNSEIMNKKGEIVNYCITVLNEVELSSIIHNAKDRVSFIKDLMKLIHA